MRRPMLIAAFWSTIGIATAQEEYTLKFKLDADAGKGTIYKSSTKDGGVMKIINTETKMEVEVKSEGSETLIEKSVIAVDREGNPTTYARHYEKQNKRENGKTTTQSVEGKTLYWVIPKTGKPRIGIVGENSINAKDTEKLFEKLERPGEFEALIQVLTPGKSVRVGDSWKLDAVKYAEHSAMVVEGKASSGKAKFSKVETVGKSLFGTFEIEFVLMMKKFAKKDAMEFVTPLEFTAKGTLRIAIDGSTTEYEEKMAMSARGTSDIAPASMKMKIEADMHGFQTTTRSVEKPAAIQAIPAKLTWLPAPGDWIALAPKDAGFKAEMPGKPVETLSDNREFFNDQWLLEIDNRQLAYLVQRAKIVKAGVGLKDVVDSIVKQYPQAKVDQIKIAGEDASLLAYTADGIEFFHGLVVKDNVLWQVIAGGTPGKSKKEDRDRFFKSLELVVPETK